MAPHSSGVTIHAMLNEPNKVGAFFGHGFVSRSFLFVFAVFE
jgi:hypothetical protein